MNYLIINISTPWNTFYYGRSYFYIEDRTIAPQRGVMKAEILSAKKLFCKEDQKDLNIRGRNTANTARLTNGFGAEFNEFFTSLV